MSDTPAVHKTLLTAQDPQGNHLHFVQFDDGAWGILVNGQPHATSWPHEKLPDAARFYRDMVFAKSAANPQLNPK